MLWSCGRSPRRTFGGSSSGVVLCVRCFVNAEAAAERYRSTQEALNLKESHAKNVSASLDRLEGTGSDWKMTRHRRLGACVRTCSALLDAMKLAEGMGSASAAAAGSSREAKDHTTCLGSRTHAKCQSTQAPAHIGDNARSHSVVRWYAII